MFSKIFRRSRQNDGTLRLTEPTASEWLVKSVKIDGVDFEKGPPDANCFYLPFTVEVGRDSSPKTYSYQGTMCSPAGWVDHLTKNGIEYIQSRDMLLLSRYDAKLAMRALQENVNSLAYLFGARHDERPPAIDYPAADWVIKNYGFYYTPLDRGPANPDCFGDTFFVDVGLPNEEGVMTFEVGVVTPAGLLGEDEYYFPAKPIVLPRYSLETLLKMVRENMARLGSFMADVS